MRSVSLTCLALSAALLGLLAPVGIPAQARIQGQVTDGTTRRPVANQKVHLLVPKEGMQQVATASTDTNGRFAFAPDGIDATSFYLLEARFQDVAYHAPARFDSAGTANVSLTVYESTSSAPELRVQSLRALIRAEGTRVRIQEEYDLLNSVDPPRAFVSRVGTFRFHLSPGGGQPTVVVAGLMNIPLPQTAEAGKLPGEFFIRYPLKPGITRVGLEYELDYSSSRVELGDRVAYPVDLAEIYVSPSSLSVDSTLFKSAGVDPAQGVAKLEARNLPQNTPLEIRVSGEAAAARQAEAARGEAEVKVVPNSMTRLGAPLLVCFLLVLLWAFGVRVAKEWPQWQARRGRSPAQKQLTPKVDALLNSIADLDELFAAHKIAEARYWKERLELKARLTAALKKVPPSLPDSYATRNTAR